MSKPYLDIYLDLGFMKYQTVVMKQTTDRFEYCYLVLRWKVLKWEGGFKLYSPEKWQR